MKKIDINKLIKEKKIQVAEVKLNTKYLIVFNIDAVSREEIQTVERSDFMQGSLVIGVYGDPEKAMSVYEVKS